MQEKSAKNEALLSATYCSKAREKIPFKHTTQTTYIHTFIASILTFIQLYTYIHTYIPILYKTITSKRVNTFITISTTENTQKKKYENKTKL